MSLRAFHVVFILISLTTAAFVAAWSLRYWSRTQETVYAVMSVASAASGVALAVYLTWFIKKSKTLS